MFLFLLGASLAASGCAAVASATAPGPGSAPPRPAASIGLDPHPLAGPYETLEDYCAEIAKRKGKARCAEASVDAIDEPEPPYEAVEILRVKQPDTGVDYCEVGVLLGDGWFVTEGLFICGEVGNETDIEVINLELVAQKDSPPILRIEVRITVQSKDSVLESEELALCGIGDSGELTCTDAFTRYEHVLLEDGASEARTMSVTLSRFGVLKVRGDGLVDGEIVDLTGDYRITFP